MGNWGDVGREVDLGKTLVDKTLDGIVAFKMMIAPSWNDLSDHSL